MSKLANLPAKRWKGIWVMAVAVIHMAFTPIISPHTFVSLFEHGFIDSVKDMETAAGVWFFLFGLPLYSVGQMIDWLEKRGNEIPVSAPLGLTLVTVVGIMIFPASGFYLLIPAIVGLFAVGSGVKQSVI